MILNKTRKKLLFTALAAILSATSLSGCGQNAKEESDSAVSKTNDTQKYEQIIDIRTPDKYIGWKNDKGLSGHIKNAIDFPVSWFTYANDDSKIQTELKRRGIDPTKPTLIYSDDTATKDDVDKFKSAGFKDIAVLDGGINEYSKNNTSLDKLEGYQMYVSPQWVQDLADGKSPEGYSNNKFKIVEISLASEKDEYKNGHIKGAININADYINHIPGPRSIQEYEAIPMEKQLTFWGFYPDAKIKEVLEKNGIDKDTTVVLYATEKATTAANRVALVMDYAGVKDIRLLNGGKVLWNLEKRPLDKNIETPTKVDFGSEVPQNPQIVFDFNKERKLVDDKNTVIASVRSWDEYLGKISGYTYIDKAGDIKNARFAYAGSNPYAMEDYRNIDNTMFNYQICADRWKKWGITPDKTVSFHCGTGWRAAETYYIAKALGWKNIGVYVGGWYQWSKMENAPVKENGLPKDAPEKTPEEYFTSK